MQGIMAFDFHHFIDKNEVVIKVYSCKVFSIWVSMYCRKFTLAYVEFLLLHDFEILNISMTFKRNQIISSS